MDFSGVVIGHVMIVVRLLLLFVFAGMTLSDTVFASSGILGIVERAVGHVSARCIIACIITHIVVNQAAVGWLLRRRYRRLVHKTTTNLASLLLV